MAEAGASTYPKWEDNFWGPDYSGFECVSSYMRASKHATQGLVDFIKGRVKIYEEFGRKLQEHVKKEAMGQLREETGSIRNAWDALLTDTEQASHIYLNAAQEVTTRIEKPLSEYLLKQREEVKMLVDNVKRLQQSRNAAIKRCTQAQSSFETKSKEFSVLSEKTRTATGKDQPKMQAKLKAKQQEVENSDNSLSMSIEKVVEAQSVWAQETKSVLGKLENFEADRYERLRGDVWKMQNVFALALTAQDQSIEQSRVALEAVNFEDDQHAFVNRCKTGKELPSFPEICYSHPNSIVVRGPRQTRGPANAVGVLSLSPVTGSPVVGGREYIDIGAADPQRRRNASLQEFGSKSSPQRQRAASQQEMPRTPPTNVQSGGSVLQQPTPNWNSEAEPVSDMHYHTVSPGSENVNDYSDSVYKALPPNSEPLPDPGRSRKTSGTMAAPSLPRRNATVQVEVMYDYPSQGSEELNLSQGQVLTVLEKENDTWWKGKDEYGNVGMFPMEFTQEI